MRRRHLVLGVTVLLVLSCAGPSEEPVAVEEVAEVQWEKVLPGLMSDTQKAQQELVATAVNALAAEMMGELTAALDAGDPTAAIGVCKDKAPNVAAHVSGMYGVKIGRTSYRLRNPANVAPKWAEEYVSELVDDPTFVAGPNGELGALLPIRLKAECQMCHGPAEEIDDGVMAAISDVYPNDLATGFVEGDLRGWFWVEAPPGEAETAATEM
ncbi:MAG: DUF3365 domain-containing protein [Acidobacteria bacterium]|jgi:hypothetical protein|nr:DUF3365 domain-containing protein [Acidobacteriota bacterium]